MAKRKGKGGGGKGTQKEKNKAQKQQLKASRLKNELLGLLRAPKAGPTHLTAYEQYVGAFQAFFNQNLPYLGEKFYAQLDTLFDALKSEVNTRSALELIELMLRFGHAMHNLIPQISSIKQRNSVFLGMTACLEAHLLALYQHIISVDTYAPELYKSTWLVAESEGISGLLNGSVADLDVDSNTCSVLCSLALLACTVNLNQEGRKIQHQRRCSIALNLIQHALIDCQNEQSSAKLLHYQRYFTELSVIDTHVEYQAKQDMLVQLVKLPQSKSENGDSEPVVNKEVTLAEKDVLALCQKAVLDIADMQSVILTIRMIPLLYVKPIGSEVFFESSYSAALIAVLEKAVVQIQQTAAYQFNIVDEDHPHQAHLKSLPQSVLPSAVHDVLTELEVLQDDMVNVTILCETGEEYQAQKAKITLSQLFKHYLQIKDEQKAGVIIQLTQKFVADNIQHFDENIFNSTLTKSICTLMQTAEDRTYREIEKFVIMARITHRVQELHNPNITFCGISASVSTVRISGSSLHAFFLP